MASKTFDIVINSVEDVAFMIMQNTLPCPLQRLHVCRMLISKQFANIVCQVSEPQSCYVAARNISVQTVVYKGERE